MKIEDLLKFRLADQHNLEEFGFGSLQVREHPDVLERLNRHVLSFVNNQQHGTALLIFLHQYLVQAVQHLNRVIRSCIEPQFLVDRLQKVYERNVGIENIDDL